MNKTNYLSSILALSLSSTAIAGTMGPSFNPWTTVVTLSGGPMWAYGSELQSVYFSPELSRTYDIDAASSTLGYGELFVGIQRIFNPKYEGQLGVAFAAATPLKIAGDIWDFDDPRFNNYWNSYKVKHTHVALKGKLLTNTKYSLKPWVSASIGAGFNRATEYQVIPKICEVIPLPSANFASSRTSTFVYTLGAGAQRVLSQHWQVGVGYEFVNWGKSQFGRAPAQPYGSHGLTIDPIRSNGVLLNLTWLA